MSDQNTNYALYVNGVKDVALKAKTIPTPEKDEIVIKIMATGLAIVDAAITLGLVPAETFGVKFPHILGLDASGVVYAVGDDVQNLKIGDRVFSAGKFGENTGGFQQYASAQAALTAKIPDSVSFDDAASLSLNLATAALGLYGGPVTTIPGSSGAGLTPPWVEGGRSKYAELPIVIIGGSSSVGQFGIQLAKLSGFHPIIVTASDKHTSSLKSLGATTVIARSLPTNELISAARSAANGRSIKLVFDIIGQNSPEEIALGIVDPEGTIISNPRRYTTEEKILKELEVKKVTVCRMYGSFHLPEYFEAGVKAYPAFSELLADGNLKPNTAEVIPGGLNGIIGGLERTLSGQVSGVKLVVRPQETIVSK